MSIRFGVLCALPICAYGSSLLAEPEVVVSGHVRAREEFRHELFSPVDPSGEESGDQAHLRSRVRVDGAINEQLDVVVEFQDVRLFGSEGSTVADTEGVDLKRGYIAVKPAKSDVTIKVGRWVMAYGDQRLIGHLEWVDQGRSYDGVNASYRRGRTFVDLFAVRVRETLAMKDDLHFGGIYGGVGLTKDVAIEMYALGLRDAVGEGTNFATLGTRAELTRDGIDGSAELAAQVGDSFDSDLVAAAFAAKAGFTFPGQAAVRLGGEVAYASGDSDPTDSTDNTFRTLFPTNHLHYGYADLAAWQNLIALRASASAKPTKTTSASLDIHRLWLAESAGGWFNAGGGLVRQGDEAASSSLGTEIDAVIGWKPIEGLALQAGAAFFFGGGFVADTGGGGNAIFAYGQAAALF